MNKKELEERIAYLEKVIGLTAGCVSNCSVCNEYLTKAKKTIKKRKSPKNGDGGGT